MDLAALSRILLVKPSSLGDIVHSLPVLWWLRKQAPQADIRWLVNSAWTPLLREHPMLDGLIEFPREQMKGLGAAVSWYRWVKTLEPWTPDLALDLQGLLRSALLARATAAKLIIGYSDAREGANLLHHRVISTQLKRSDHAVERYLSCFSAWGISLPEEVEFPLPEGCPPAAAETLPRRFIVLHPFARGAGKSLSKGQVERLAKSLRLPVVVVGRNRHAELDLPADGFNWLNQTTLAELIWILRRAAWTISVDSGPMHLAAAVNPRLLALHSWSDPSKVGPYSRRAWVWKNGQIVASQRVSSLIGAERGAGFDEEMVDQIAAWLNARLVAG